MTRMNLKDESGQIMVAAVFSMTILIGFVAFATDVGYLLRQKRIAQTVADAAAMAAATEALNEGTPTTVSTGMWTAAAHDATMNGYTPGSSNGANNSANGVTLTINTDAGVTISGYNSPGYVQSIVTLNTNTVFMAVFGVLFQIDHPGAPSRSNVGVTATAIAADSIMSNGCVWVQNDGNYDTADAVDMGGNSLINAPQCGMTVNGDIVTGGSASISAKFVAETGSAPAGSGWIGGIPPQSDPLSYLQEPANQPTAGTTLGGTCGSIPAGAVSAGMSCIYDFNGGNLSGTLQSNTIYYFDSLVNSGGGPYVTGTVTGSNIMIYLAGNTLPIDFSNNGQMCLTPPGYTTGSGGVCSNSGTGSCIGSSNPFCGILIDAPTDGSAGQGTYSCSHGVGGNQGSPGEMYLNFGSSTTVMDGIVYAPYMQLYGQDEGAATTFATDLVIGNICIQSATFSVDGFSGPYSPLTRVGLVY